MPLLIPRPHIIWSAAKPSPDNLLNYNAKHATSPKDCIIPWMIEEAVHLDFHRQRVTLYWQDAKSKALKQPGNKSSTNGFPEQPRQKFTNTIKTLEEVSEPGKITYTTRSITHSIHLNDNTTFAPRSCTYVPNKTEHSPIS